MISISAYNRYSGVNDRFYRASSWQSRPQERPRGGPRPPQGGRSQGGQSQGGQSQGGKSPRGQTPDRPSNGEAHQNGQRPPQAPPHERPPQRPFPDRRPPQKQGLAALLPPGLDAGDLMLAALLLFLYIESKDEDFLIILIVVGFSILKPDKEKKEES